MQASISHWFPNTIEDVYRHYTELENFTTWAKVPEDIKFELSVNDSEDKITLSSTSFMYGGWWKQTVETTYIDRLVEDRGVMVSNLDPDGNETFGTEYSLLSEFAYRTRYKEVNGGTSVLVDLHVKPYKFSYTLDAFLFLRGWKKRSKMVLELLDEYLN